MSRRELIVLKFGGSVLEHPKTIDRAVHEIHRWRREGLGVVAVVSAFAGRTDRLFEDCRAEGMVDPHQIAERVGRGERESAAFLCARMVEAGLPVHCLDHRDVRFRADGDPSDADPIDIDTRRILAELEHDRTVVVPGFVAVDPGGRDVLLGRGGSDLSALVLAHALRCRCRLLKDVDGLYESDPRASATVAPRRFRSATFAVALATDGTIVQHKATRFARARGLQFELGSLDRVESTRIGATETSFDPPDIANSDFDVPRTVALLGHGTVGTAVLDLIARLEDRLDLIAIGSSRPLEFARVHSNARLVTEVATAASSGADIVVEVLGGMEPARSLALAALHRGSHLVTANKVLLAHAGPELERIARSRGVRVLGSAAVGGATPVLERLSRLAGHGAPRVVRGVLNSTVNVVLDGIARGVPFATSLECARRRGLAERDATADLDGSDAACKLVVLARALGWLDLGFDDVVRQRLADAEFGQTHSDTGAGTALRQVSTLERDDEQTAARVRIEAVGPGQLFHAVDDDWNSFELEWENGDREVLSGRGAGGRPTAEALVGDLLELARSVASRPSSVHPSWFQVPHEARS